MKLAILLIIGTSLCLAEDTEGHRVKRHGDHKHGGDSHHHSHELHGHTHATHTSDHGTNHAGHEHAHNHDHDSHRVKRDGDHKHGGDAHHHSHELHGHTHATHTSDHGTNHAGHEHVHNHDHDTVARKRRGVETSKLITIISGRGDSSSDSDDSDASRDSDNSRHSDQLNSSDSSDSSTDSSDEDSRERYRPNPRFSRTKREVQNQEVAVNSDENSEEGLYEYAICYMTPNRMPPRGRRHNVRGPIYIRQKSNSTEVEMKLTLRGFSKMTGGHHNHNHVHGFHLHELGDLSQGCQSLGGHYNPRNVNHAGPNDTVRHPGDFGNISCDSEGAVVQTVKHPAADLDDIIGRSLVIHALADDLGKVNNTGSRASGNAGPRVACCVVGRSNGNHWNA